MKEKNLETLSQIINTILNISFFGMVASIIIALTFWVQFWWPEMPFIFKIFWILGTLNFFVLFLEKDWSIFKGVVLR